MRGARVGICLGVGVIGGLVGWDGLGGFLVVIKTKEGVI